MLFQKTHKKQIFLCALLLSIPHITTMASTPVALPVATSSLDVNGNYTMPTLTKEQEAELQKEYQTLLEGTLKEILELYGTLQNTLQDLALLVSNDGVKVANKQNHIAAISSLQTIIDMCKKDAFVHIDEHTLAYLLQLFQAMAEHINRSLDNGFYTFEPFDIAAAQKRSPLTDLSLQSIQSDIKRTKHMATNLVDKISNVGLTLVNRWYRTFDKYIVQPCEQYSIPSRVKLGALAAAFGVLLVWRCTDWGDIDKGSTSKFWQWWRNTLGVHATHTKEGVYDEAVKHVYQYKDELINGVMRKVAIPESHFVIPCKIPGTVDFYLTKKDQHYLPLLVLAYERLHSAYSDEIAHSGSEIKKAWQAITNKLKGGVYTEKQLEDVHEVDTRITFDDVVGMEHGKKILGEVLEYLKDPERFDRMGKMPVKGYLFLGPSRTGKSYLAQAFAGEIKKELNKLGNKHSTFKFFSLSAAQVNNRGIGYLKDLAKKYAPCVLFIDELDLLALQRAGNASLLSDFLVSMSGFSNSDPNKQVILLAATNMPENLDFALRTRGRFGVEIPFEYPCLKDRINFLLYNLQKLGLNIENFNVTQLAQEAEGRSYEDLDTIITGAFNRAKINGELLTQERLEQSFDESLRNIITSHDKDIPAEEKRLMAVHQAGKALANVLLDMKQKLAKVTIRPVVANVKEELIWQQYGKDEHEKQQKVVNGRVFLYYPNDSLKISTREERIKECSFCLAGFAAEEILLGSCGYNYQTEDKQQAVKVAQAIALEGLDVKTLSKKMQGEYHDKAIALIDTYFAQIKALLVKNQPLLEKLARKLQQKETLSAFDVQQIAAGMATSSEDEIEIVD